MKLLPLVLLCLFPVVALAQKEKGTTCRILFLDGPDQAPDTLHLFDGTRSLEVDLPRMNFSKIYELRSGPLTLHLLPTPLTDPEEIPAGAPSTTIGAGVTDFYLLVTSDPSNEVAPVRMQVINAGSDSLKRGQMLWFNLTANTVGGIVGSETLAIRPGTRAILDPPATGSRDYPVNLNFRIPGKEHLYPLCETRWLHDPRSRSLAFILARPGVRTPRVMVFPDYRGSDDEEKPAE